MATLKTVPTNNNDSDATLVPQPVWPLPKLSGVQPVLLVHDPSDPGVELAYEHKHDPDGPLVRSTRGIGTSPFYLPPLTPVFAVFDGRVMYAGKHADGHTIIIEHANGWMTFYSHLEQMFVLPTDRRHRARPQHTKVGNILGYAGKIGLDSIRPIRFELWKYDEHSGYVAIDPIRFMRRWRVRAWSQGLAVNASPSAEAA